jgi:hypothetical protein
LKNWSAYWKVQTSKVPMIHLAFEVLTAILALQNTISCSERFQGVAYLRPFLLKNHPIVVTHGSVSLPDISFNYLHEEFSSLLIYDYRRLQLYSANKQTVPGHFLLSSFLNQSSITLILLFNLILKTHSAWNLWNTLMCILCLY